MRGRLRNLLQARVERRWHDDTKDEGEPRSIGNTTRDYENALAREIRIPRPKHEIASASGSEWKQKPAN